MRATLSSCLIAVAVVLLTRFIRRKRPAPFPPGPKGLPFVGNMFDMPTTYIWRTFTQWGRTYGDIVYVNPLGRPVVILNSAKQAKAMLDTKSSIYCDRPTSQMGDLIGWSEGLGMMHYGRAYREQKRYIHSAVGSKKMTAKYYGILIDEQSKLLKRLLISNENLGDELRRTTTAISIRIAYGYVLQEGTDPMVTVVEKAIRTIDALATPGLWLVEALPFLRHLPAWFPGAGFQIAAAEMRQQVLAMLNMPYEFVKLQSTRNEGLSRSFIAEHLDQQNSGPEAEIAVKWAAAFINVGGSDSMSSAMHSFILAMMLHPEVQRRAQAEIDAVVGNARLPSFEDREGLPFVDAIVKEILRWRPPGPVGIPHRAMKDDIHEGYFIPKGTTVVMNIWACLHDPNVYRNPDVFDPDRFVFKSGNEAGVPDPYEICFGYGRRRCPGVNFADASLFLWCSMTLAVYHVSKAVGPDGEIVEPMCEITDGTGSHPKPFKCSITPRSEKAERLILSLN